MKGVGMHKQYTTVGPHSRESALRTLDVDVIYDWSRTPDIYTKENGQAMESIPMIWGRGDVGKPIGGNSEWVLGFNESDSMYQANIQDPKEEARLWRQVEQAHPDKKLVSPVPTADNPNRRYQFLDAYEGLYKEKPRFDAISMHIYPRSMEYLKSMTEEARKFAKIFHCEIWVTEFAYLPCWGDNAGAFLSEMAKFFCEAADITRWFAFILCARGNESWNFKPIVCNPTLFNMGSGNLTELGRSYAAAPGQGYADPRADITGPNGKPDGKVDIFDLTLVGANFGKETDPALGVDHG